MTAVTDISAAAVANSRWHSARSILVASFATAALLCVLLQLAWWTVFPSVVLLLDVFARLHDRAVLGVVEKTPSPQSAFDDPTAVYTWQQLADHASEESAWIAVDGLVYDVTSFIPRHPGGKEILLLAVGRDATDLFKSYHPFTQLPRKVLSKYHIGSLVTFEHPVYKPDSGFYREACLAVKDYFDRTGLDSKEPQGMFIRMLPVYVVFSVAYVVINYLENVPFVARAVMAVVMGVCQGLPLTGWMHDASHTAIGHSERWWFTVGRFALDYVSGGSLLSWRNQHVIGHHIYTNVMAADPDLPAVVDGDPRRILNEQTYMPMYRWQHIYLPPLYGILGLKSRIQDVTEIFSRLTNGPVRVNPISTEDYLRMVQAKLVWAFYRIVVPLVFFSALSVSDFIPLFLVTEFTTGYWLAFNFQVSHVSTDVDYHFSDESKREEGKCPAVIDDEWAISQVRTTVDYSHDGAVATYMSGGLNYQTIHHLFPTVSQTHYPAITPLVMKVAEKHGVKFNVFNHFGSAIYAHWKHLRDMGLAGKPAELKME